MPPLWDTDSEEEETTHVARSKSVASTTQQSAAKATPTASSAIESPVFTAEQVQAEATPPPVKRPKLEVTKVPFNAVPCKSVFDFKRMNMIEEGGYGVVFRAKNKHTGMVYALKKIKVHNKQDGFPITALRELDTLLSCSHPNIVNVCECVIGEQDDVYMVMEFVEHDLKSLMWQRHVRFTASQVKCLMLQLLNAVDYLHSKWYLHRDLKTPNILLNNKGVLKLCDFGMARCYGHPPVEYTPLNHVVTLTYRPPEGLLGVKVYATAADMWMVGCIFAELLSNNLLFQCKSELELLKKQCELLGTPNESTWEGWNEIQFTQTWTLPQCPTGELRKLFPSNNFTGGACLTEQGFDLLSRLLCMCPEHRISAADAKEHPYFKEEPKPATREELARVVDRLPSMHEQEKNHRAKSTHTKHTKPAHHVHHHHHHRKKAEE